MASLSKYHHADESRDKTSRIVAWVVIALLVAGFGIYIAEAGFFSSHNPVMMAFPRAM